MEVHAATVREAATGSSNLADLLPLAVKKHAGLPAQLYKDQASGEWREVSYEELGEIVREASSACRTSASSPGDKVAILAHTRPEWTYACFAHPLRRRDGGADLPDQLARGVPVRAEPLGGAGGVRRGRRAAREGPRRARTELPDARARSSRWSRRRGDDVISFDELCASAAAAATEADFDAAHRRRRRPDGTPPTSTRPARPARPRAACSTTPTTARSPTWSRQQDDLVERRA